MLGKHKKQKRENIDIFNNTPDEMDLLLPDELQEKKDHDKFNSVTQKNKVENQNQTHNARKEGIQPVTQKR